MTKISAYDFVKDILVNKLNAKKIIVGYDFNFARNKEGNVSVLNDLSKEFKFELDDKTSVDIKERTLNERSNYSLLNISYQMAFGLKKNKETIIEVLNSYTEHNYKMIDSKTGHLISKDKKIVNVKKVDSANAPEEKFFR